MMEAGRQSLATAQGSGGVSGDGATETVPSRNAAVGLAQAARIWNRGAVMKDRGPDAVAAFNSYRTSWFSIQHLHVMCVFAIDVSFIPFCHSDLPQVPTGIHYRVKQSHLQSRSE